METTTDDEELAALERELRAAVREAMEERGWRTPELAHAVGTLRSRRDGDLIVRLDEGIGAWCRRHRVPAYAVAGHVRLLVALIALLPTLPPTDDTTSTAHTDPALLGRVRALLAKAESTLFEPEAEALTAKAHELMARHSLDRAVVTGCPAAGDVVTRRVLIGEPYARARFRILTSVARAHRCEAVWWQGIGLATVFGVPDDLDACEVVYTSVVLQATSAVMRRSPRERTTPAGLAAYRRSFLYAFAARIGQRLRADTDRVVADVASERGDDVLPVLASREAAVRAAVDAIAPGRKMRWSVSDGRGWAAGVAAADAADLGRDPSFAAGRRHLRLVASGPDARGQSSQQIGTLGSGT